jgi:hypothetical protein
LKPKRKPAKKKSSLVWREVVKIVDLDPITAGEEQYWFRIEVLKTPPKLFTARVWRTEQHRIRPATVPRNLDQEIVVDASYLFEEIEGKTVDQVIDSTLKEIEDRFLNGAAK